MKAVALELATVREVAISCAVARVEAEVNTALEKETPDELGPFGALASAVKGEEPKRG